MTGSLFSINFSFCLNGGSKVIILIEEVHRDQFNMFFLETLNVLTSFLALGLGSSKAHLTLSNSLLFNFWSDIAIYRTNKNLNIIILKNTNDTSVPGRFSKERSGTPSPQKKLTGPQRHLLITPKLDWTTFLYQSICIREFKQQRRRQQ